MEEFNNDLDSKLFISALRSMKSSIFTLEYTKTVIRIQDEEWEDNTTVRGHDQREMDNMMSDFIKTRLARSFKILEGVTNKFVHNEFREGTKYTFPEIKRTLAVYTGKDESKENKAELDYFAEQDKVWSGRSGAVKTEAYNTVERCLDLKNDARKKGRFPMDLIRVCLIYGLLVLFMAGSFAPHIPDYVGQWLAGEYGGVVNIICIAIVVLGSFWQVGTQDGYRGLSGLVAKISWIHALGAIGIGLVMLGGYPDRLEPPYLEILGCYSLIAGLCGILDGIVNKIKASFQRRRSRKEFIKLWQQEREFLDHYITFHTQWWDDQRGYEAEPDCIKTMRARYDVLEKEYRELS